MQVNKACQLSNSPIVITDRINAAGNAIASVCLSHFELELELLHVSRS